MNKQRATEIATSPIMENVTFEGRSVYIQHVDEVNETARIYPLDDPENEQNVPINSLVLQSLSDEGPISISCRTTP
jgi:small acid-soluble spore protein H (minor)